MTRAVLDVVGCGAVVWQCHLPALQWLERYGFAEVRYCIDPSPHAASTVAARLRRARPLPVSTPSEVDVSGASMALVATPPEAHYAWAYHYLAAGAGVLVEKPAVLTTQEYSLLAHASQAIGLPVLVGHVRRLFPSARAARDAVRGHAIGSVRRIEAYEGFRWGWTTRTDYPVRSRAGGVVYAYGPHAVDTSLFVGGIDDQAADKVEVGVVGLDRWPGSEPSHDFRAELVLRGDDFNVSLLIHVSRTELLANVIRVRGERGEILLSSEYGRSALVRTERDAKRLIGTPGSEYATSLVGCFLAEHIEMWRALGGESSNSPLALDHFGLLTHILEVLASGG